MQTDAVRRDLHDQLGTIVADEPRNLLMELLPAVGWGDVARQSDITAVRGEMAELRCEMAELRAELRAEMADLRTELRAEMATLRADVSSELSDVRSELVRLERRIDRQLIHLAGINFASMVALMSAMLAAIQLT